MKSKLTKLFLSFFIIFILATTFSLVDYVEAVNPTYFIDFHDGTLGNPYTSSNLTTQIMSGADFEISNVVVHSDTRSFYESTGASRKSGYWTLIYGSTSFLYNFTIWINIHYSYAIRLYFNDSSTGTCILQFQGNGASTIQYVDYVGATHNLYGYSSDIWFKLRFNINDNDSVDYYCGSGTGGWERGASPRNVKVNPRIDTITFMSVGTANQNYYDDIRYYVSDTFPGYNASSEHGDVSLYPLVDCTEYSQTFGTVAYSSGGNDYAGTIVEHKTQYQLNSIIHAVDLYVGENQINFVSGNLSDYELKINGVYAGCPTYIFLTDDLQNWIIRWYNLNINISHVNGIFEFKCSKHTVGLFGSLDYYWYDLGITEAIPSFKTGGDGYFNGEFDGFVGKGLGNYQLRMCSYATYREDVSEFNDKIYAFPNSQELYNTVSIYGTLSHNSYVKLYKYGTGYVVIPGFTINATTGYFVMQPTFSLGFTPDNVTDIGNYKVIITRNNANISYTNFTIVDIEDKTYQLWITPNPCEDFLDNLNISWNFEYIDSIKGAVLFSTLPYFTTDSFYNVKTGIESNGSRTWTNWYKMSNSPGGLYFFLVRCLTNTSYEVKDTFHLTSGYAKKESEIYVSPQESKLTKNADDMYEATVSVYGKNGAIGLPVYICINGVKFEDVTGIAEFSYPNKWTFYHSGFYNVTLMSLDELGNPNITLAYNWFKIYDYGSTIPGEELPSDAENYISNLPSEVKLIIGIAIVSIFTLIPLLLALTLGKSTNISTLDIPGLLYGIFFILGIVVSIVFGFFEVWVLFFVLFALILIFAIFWVQRKIAD